MAVTDAEGDPETLPSDLEPAKGEDAPMPPSFGRLINPLLATSTQPEQYHWQRRVATFSWDHLLKENMQNCTLTQLLKAWQSMPSLHEGSLRGTAHNIHLKREKRERETREHAQKVKDFFDIHTETEITDAGALRVILKQVVMTIKELTFAEPDIVGRIYDLPLAPTHDSKEHMRMRCEYDERLSFPLDALLEFQKQDGQTVADYLGVKTGTRQRAAAFRFYRCPFDYMFQLEGKTFGPFPCGAVLSARSDWHHIVKTTGKRKNVWQCKNCTGDWSSGKTGTRLLQILTKDWIMNIILDEPEQHVETKWQNERIAYYSRLEPHDAPRDVKPYISPQKVAKRLRLEGEDSDKMWRMVMQNHELHEYEEIEQLAGLAIRRTRDQPVDAAPEESVRNRLEALRLKDIERAQTYGLRIESNTVWHMKPTS
jgi:hypothetical protein